jgi:acetylornithine/succinyldiaminopimelate/putrescine aminotransferase
MAKGMGNGFPVGGIITHPKFEAAFFGIFIDYI